MVKKLISIILLNSFLSGCVHYFGQSTLPQHSDAGIVTVDANLPPVQLPPLPPPVQLTFPTTDGGTGTNGELIAPLHLNARAPFDGVLFNGPAVAYVASQYQYIQQRCRADYLEQEELAVAQYNANLQRLQLALRSSDAQNRIILAGRDEEINSLNHIVTQQQHAASFSTLQTVLWFGGGLLIGAVIAGGAVYLTTR